MIGRRELAGGPSGLSVVVGLAAIVSSALYFVTDVLELAQGGFSTVHLSLTLPAEAAIPLFVVGLYLLQRPPMGTLGLAGAAGYAYVFVFFTGTVVFAIVNGTRHWDQLVDQFGVWMTIHGVVMVLAGLAFGLAVVRAGVLPRWTGLTLMAGVVLMAVSSTLPDFVQTASAGVRDLAFVGMGASLLVGRRRALGPSRTSALAPAGEPPETKERAPARASR